MKIRSSVAPTPIVSVTVNNSQAESQPSATPAPAPIRVETAPMTVEMGDKIIELQPGELAKVVDRVNQTARVFNQSLQFEMGEGKQVV
ncbi:MAG TPA: hypothetical protein VNT01_09880, partial [Symbiobacteriaceae bacterium]|nr:hypothetical protein [Symbiobacteriaceae bacterium]